MVFFPFSVYKKIPQTINITRFICLFRFRLFVYNQNEMFAFAQVLLFHNRPVQQNIILLSTGRSRTFSETVVYLIYTVQQYSTVRTRRNVFSH